MKGFVEDNISCCCFFIFDFVIKGSIFRVSDFWDKNICFITNFFSDSHLNTSGHGVINDVFIRSFFFSHKIGVSTCLWEGEVFKADVTVFIISRCSKELALFITKVKGEFVFFKVSAMKSFRQVKVNMSVFKFFDAVIKSCIFRINDARDKRICRFSDFLSDFNGDICNHVIVNHVFIASFNFCDHIMIVACFVVSETCEGNFSVFVITCLGNDLTLIVTKVERKFTCF